jgi:hypothetical protein
MKNLIILILLAIIAYLLVTSGILNRAVQSVPQLSGGTPNPNETPRISVTVYSPYGTGNVTPSANRMPGKEPPLTLLPAGSTAVPDATLPPPIIIIPEVPPTLDIPNTPTPPPTFKIQLETPRDGETTTASPLLVTGVTAPNAIVSVNDEVGFSGADGRFSITIPLEPGPNVLEIIASQTDGQQTFAIVTVLYQK